MRVWEGGTDAAQHPTDSVLPVAVSLETPDEDAVRIVARFATIDEAVAYLGSPGIDPEALEAGRYGIDAPHGAGSDDEAIDHARARGFQLFWAAGSACWANSGVEIHANRSGRGWHCGFDSLAAAAHAALASVDPD